jgi:L-Ala-D/L-Glu epimerase
MTFTLNASIEIWPVAGAFTISRGAKTEVAVVRVDLEQGGITGRGEATPIYYHGETAEGCVADLQNFRFEMSLDAIQFGLPRGAARNALDAALWDWTAKATGMSAAARAGVVVPATINSAITISVASPETMQADAKRLASLGHGLIKLKLAGKDDLDRVSAVRAGAPKSRLIVDANEAWTGMDVAAMAASFLPYGVELIEQPVAAGKDHLLDGVQSPIPLGADESVQDRADLARCLGRYDAINIKLDKAGGLTEGLALAADAQSAGLRIMVGCMLSTSLGIAPALILADKAEWVDLDGPILLARDRPGGVTLDGGMLLPPVEGFWG